MRTIETTIYTVDELSTAAFDRARIEYAQTYENLTADDDMASLRAFVAAAGMRLTNFNIGAYAHSSLRVDGDDDILAMNGRRAWAWLENRVLAETRIPWTGSRRASVRKYGWTYRPGRITPCPWTGYYMDEVLLDSFRESLRDGMTVRDSFAALADTIRRAWEEDYADATGEEGFRELARANGWEFTEDGSIA